MALSLTLFVFLSVAALTALAIANPQEGPLRHAVDSAESALPDEAIYETHLFLARLLSLCSCTVEASDAEYAKAAFHRPSKRGLE